jgi:hypothetical protein
MAKTRKRARRTVKKAAPAPFVPADYATVKPAWYGWSFSSHHFGAAASWNLYNWALAAEFSMSRYGATVALSLGPFQGHISVYF